LSGFAGRFALDGGPVARSDIEPMAAAAGRRRTDALVYLARAFGICAADSRIWSAAADPEPVLASTSQTIVAFDGRLDNRRELADTCGLRIPGGDDELSDAAVVLAAYHHLGDEFAGRLNGDFAVAVFDVGRQRLLLARDVMSARSLYYSSVAGSLLFGTKIKSLLADPRVVAAPDEDGLAELVLDYWCDDRRTCFKGIQSVAAGEVIVASRERLERKRHWTFDPGREIRHRSFAEYCGAFRSLFATSVERRLRSQAPIAVSVSGGVDSSSIFCQAAALIRDRSPQVRLRGVSLIFPPDSAAAEAEFVDSVERACRLPLLRIPVSGYRFLDHADQLVRQLESPAIVADTQHALFETTRDAGCQALLSGFFGDQMLTDRGYLVDLARRGRWLKIRHDVREFQAWDPDAGAGFFGRDLRSRLMRGLPPRWLYQFGRRVAGPWRARSRYPPWFTASFRRRAAARARVRFLESHGSANAHAEQYYRHVTAGHYAHSVRCERALGEMYGVDVRYPFRDRDLVSFLMAIPGEVVNWQGRPKGLLREALTGVVPDVILARRSKADFTALENQALRNEHQHLARLLSADCLAVRAGFVDGRALREWLPTLTSVGEESTALPGWRLTDVVGLELWLRNFFGGASDQKNALSSTNLLKLPTNTC
jgi:asparagine synthase (glutamine-hydrolysing)